MCCKRTSLSGIACITAADASVVCNLCIAVVEDRDLRLIINLVDVRRRCTYHTVLNAEALVTDQ